MGNLNNKSILFICSVYHGYYKQIANSLAQRGAVVTTVLDDPYSLIDLRIIGLKSIGNIIKQWVYKKYRNYIIKKAKSTVYDYVFVIRGEILSKDFLIDLRRNQSHACFILYEWDSVKNFPYLHFVPYFDKVFSFDPDDCIRYKLNYLHLFALPEFYKAGLSNLKKDIDVLLFGSYYNNRLEIGKKVEQLCLRDNKKCVILLHISLFRFLINGFREYGLGFLKELIRWKNISKGLMFISAPRKKWIKLLERSFIILDLPSSYQSGLTMRTFEALAAGCHLLTSNKNIIKENFYHTDAITILDTEDLKLPKIQISRNRKSFKKISIDYWLEAIFNKNGFD